MANKNPTELIDVPYGDNGTVIPEHFQDTVNGMNSGSLEKPSSSPTVDNAPKPKYNFPQNTDEEKNIAVIGNMNLGNINNTPSNYDRIEATYRSDWEQETLWNRRTKWEEFEYQYKNQKVTHMMGGIDTSLQDIDDQILNAQDQIDSFSTGIDLESYMITDEDGNEIRYRDAVTQQYFEQQDRTASDNAAISAIAEMGADGHLTDGESLGDTIDEFDNQKANEALADFIIATENIDTEYLVRGAPLVCYYGSHMRFLDMPESHGLYIDEKPVSYQKDYVAGENIKYFGHCKSSTPPNPDNQVSLQTPVDMDQEGVQLRDDPESVSKGCLCIPKLVEPGWLRTHPYAKLAENGTGRQGLTDTNILSYQLKDTDFSSFHEILTTKSILFCEHGGWIRTLGSGQLTYTINLPPYMLIPFGLDEAARIAYGNKYGICPYMPGTEDHHNWYMERMEEAYKDMHFGNKGKTRAEVDRLYNEYLDYVKHIGAENLSPEELQKANEFMDLYYGSDTRYKNSKDNQKPDSIGQAVRDRDIANTVKRDMGGH